MRLQSTSHGCCLCVSLQRPCTAFMSTHLLIKGRLFLSLLCNTVKSLSGNFQGGSVRTVSYIRAILKSTDYAIMAKRRGGEEDRTVALQEEQSEFLKFTVLGQFCPGFAFSFLCLCGSTDMCYGFMFLCYFCFHKWF